jgi:UDP:flavonoid glycosyltransferase YjiC (YdhE family)
MLALSPYYSSWAERLGLDFAPLGPDTQELQREGLKEIIERPELFDSFEYMHSSASKRLAALPQVVSNLLQLCRNADVLISGQWQPASRIVHELTGIPFVSISVNFLPGSKTRLSSRSPEAYRQVIASLINPYREEQGLKALSDPLTADAVSEQLTLYAISRHVHAEPEGWPSHYKMTGYFYLQEEQWEADEELEEFMSAGEKPVVMTFGSMPHRDAEAVTEVLVEAVRLAGYRAVIQRGWSGLGSRRKMPKGVMGVEYVPHGWLFDRAACVVHHGGAGTTASVFRAGVPGVFVPHSTDHPIWAEIAESLGCAGPAIPYKGLTRERLAMAIVKTMSTQKYHKAAAELGQRVRSERGVQTARHLIEQLVGA